MHVFPFQAEYFQLFPSVEAMCDLWVILLVSSLTIGELDVLKSRSAILDNVHKGWPRIAGMHVVFVIGDVF